MDHGLAVRLAHLAPLIAHALAHRLPQGRGVKELDLAPTLQRLVVIQDPHVRRDTRAVEHLRRQRNNRVDQILIEEPLADRIRTRIRVEQRRRVRHHGRAATRRAQLRRAMAQEQHLPVRLARQPMTETRTRHLRLFLHRRLLHLPVPAKRWIRQDIVESLIRVQVLQERVPLQDRIRAPALNEQVSLTQRVGGIHHLLAVDRDLHARVQLPQRLLGDQQHAARTRRRIINRTQHVLSRQRLGVRGEEHVDHQLDRVTGRVERARGLPLLVEGPVHDVLEDVAHRRILNARGPQRQRRKVLDHLQQAIRRAELGDQLGELERGPDVRDVVRETVDVAEQRPIHVVIHRRDTRQVERRGVEEAQAETIAHGDIDQVRGHVALRVDELDDVVLRVLQQALEAAQDRERQDVVAILLGFDDVTQVLVSRVPHDPGGGRCRRARCLVCHDRLAPPRL